MRPTFAILMLLGGATLYGLVCCGHWSFDAALLVVCGVLVIPGLALLGLVWMFVPAAQRPELLHVFRDTCEQNFRDFCRALTLR